MSLNRKFQDLYQPKFGDIHWSLNEVESVRFTPQIRFGTCPTIQTEDPSSIKIRYKAYFHPVDCGGNGDRQYFYVLENGILKNLPVACFVIPDNCCCYGEDNIQYTYFDRGLFDKRHVCRKINCVGGTPTYFANERQIMCCCLECYDSCNLCIGCRKRRYCGERLRYSPFDRCCCCISNKFMWLCNMCECLGPKSGEPIILLPFADCLQVDQGSRLKAVLEDARADWEEKRIHRFQIRDKYQGATSEKIRVLKYQKDQNKAASKELRESINNKLKSFESKESKESKESISNDEEFQKRKSPNTRKVFAGGFSHEEVNSSGNRHPPSFENSFGSSMRDGSPRLAGVSSSGFRPFSGFNVGPVGIDIAGDRISDSSALGATQGNRHMNPFEDSISKPPGYFNDLFEGFSPPADGGLWGASPMKEETPGIILALSPQMFGPDGAEVPPVPVALPPPTSALAAAAALKTTLLSASFASPVHPSVRPGSTFGIQGSTFNRSVSLHDGTGSTYGDLMNDLGVDTSHISATSGDTKMLLGAASTGGGLIATKQKYKTGDRNQNNTLTTVSMLDSAGAGALLDEQRDEAAHRHLVSPTRVTKSFTDSFLRTGSLPPVATNYHPLFNSNPGRRLSISNDDDSHNSFRESSISSGGVANDLSQIQLSKQTTQSPTQIKKMSSSTDFISNQIGATFSESPDETVADEYAKWVQHQLVMAQSESSAVFGNKSDSANKSSNLPSPINPSPSPFLSSGTVPLLAKDRLKFLVPKSISTELSESSKIQRQYDLTTGDAKPLDLSVDPFDDDYDYIDDGDKGVGESENRDDFEYRADEDEEQEAFAQHKQKMKKAK